MGSSPPLSAVPATRESWSVWDRRTPTSVTRPSPRGVSSPCSTPLSTESSPTGTTWRRSGTTPSTTSSALPPRSSPSSSLMLPSTPRPTGRRLPRSCSRPSTCPPCTSPSRLCSPCTPPAVQGEHSLDGDVHGGHVEGLEHDLGHLLHVGLGVEGSLSQEDGLLLGGNAELVVEGVVPDLLHVVPDGDDSVLNGVLQGEDTPLGLGLVTDVGVLLSHADHDTLVTGTSNNGGEDGPGGVVSGEAGLAHAG